MRRAIPIVLLLLGGIAAFALFGGDGGREQNVEVSPAPTPAPAPTDSAPTESATLVQPEDDGRAQVDADPRAANEGRAPGKWRNALEVRALDPRGEPLADVRLALAVRDTKPRSIIELVGAMEHELGERYRGRTDEDGRYTFIGIEPAESYALFGHHDEFSTTTIPDIAIAEEGTVEVELAFPVGISVTGIVHDEFETPIAGATVRLERGVLLAELGPRERETRVAITNTTGSYSFDYVSPGDRTLDVTASGYGGVRRQFHVSTEPVEQSFLLLPGKNIIGRVIDTDGAPIEGAKVEAFQYHSSEGNAPARVVTDADGVFRLNDLREGNYLLRYKAHGFADAKTGRVKTETEDLEVVLQPVGGVRGNVADSSGRAVKNFQAVVRKMNRRAAHSPYGIEVGKRNVRNSVSGQFDVVGLDPGEYVVQAFADGFAWNFSEPFEVITGQVTEGVRVTLSKGATITGVVLTSDGTPAVGTLVQSQPNKSIDNAWIDQINSMRLPNITRTDARTDKEGRFSLELLTSGVYQVRILDDDHPTWTKDGIEINGEETHNMGTLMLEASGIVHGKVFDAHGTPVPGAEVFLSSETVATASRKEVTDSKGAFRVERLLPGTYRISAAAKRDKSGPFSKIIDIRASEVTLEVVAGLEHLQNLSLADG